MTPARRLRAADLSAAVYGSLLVTALIARPGALGLAEPFVALTLLIGGRRVLADRRLDRARRVPDARPVTLGRAQGSPGSRARCSRRPSSRRCPAATHPFGLATPTRPSTSPSLSASSQLFLWGLAVGRALRTRLARDPWRRARGLRSGRSSSSSLKVLVLHCTASPRESKGRRGPAPLRRDWPGGEATRAGRAPEPDVLDVRADQPVVGALLDGVGGPAGVAGQRERGREQVRREADAHEHRRRVVLDVGLERRGPGTSRRGRAGRRPRPRSRAPASPACPPSPRRPCAARRRAGRRRGRRGGRSP